MNQHYIGIYGYDANKTLRGYRHNGGVAIIEDGVVLYAIEEERLSRIKNDANYPLQSIAHVLKDHAVDYVVIAGSPRHMFMYDTCVYYSMMAHHAYTLSHTLYYYKKLFDFFIHTIGAAAMRLPNTPNSLKKHPHRCIRHHTAHAASAYYTCPWGQDDVLILTLDGAGDAQSGSVWLGKNGQLAERYGVPLAYSIGNVYSVFTRYLGFKPHRHEGKILGLAAYGKPKKLAEKLLAMTEFCDKHPKFSSELMALAYDRFSDPVLDRLTEGLNKEDVAAGLQLFTEQVVLHFVRYWVKKTGVHKLALAGGVFANVKLNQRILALPEVNNIYIHPNMGDGGLAVGAALFQHAMQATSPSPKFMQSSYLGVTISDNEAKKALLKENLVVNRPENIAKNVAVLLAKGKVVARAAGRMEYGPRALGNRTLFASCNDPTINEWLNERLQRTEFMPFAPIIMQEHAKSYFPAWQEDHIAARFMTLTYDASDLAKASIPAAIHIDGTARPQVLREQDNPQVYAILKAYYLITKIPALINTSFNMHEEPIVCNATDAVRAFKQGSIDALICGCYLTHQ